ncbi:MAG: TetR/AcrR family transcriptional regulator [Sphingomonadales bacterium]
MTPRDRILSAASELFYAQGIRATGMDLVIARASVAKATLYSHFPTKDDLVLAFLERRDEAWRAWLVAAVQRLSPGPENRPLAVFAAFAERFAEEDYRGCAFINSMVELADRDHPAHLAADRRKQAVTSYIAELLAPLPLARDPQTLAQQLVMLIDGAVVTAVRQGGVEAAHLAQAAAHALLSVSLTPGKSLEPPVV